MSKKYNKIYEKNMKLLKKYYNDIFLKIEKTRVQNYRAEIIQGSNLPNIYIKESNSYYYNSINPLEDAINQVNSLNLKNSKIAIFLGFGLGYEFFYFAENMVEEQETRYIFIVEQNLEIFRLAVENIDLSLMISNPKLKLIVGEEEEGLFLKYKEFFDKEHRSILYIKAIKAIYNISALKLNKEYYIDAIKKFKEWGIYQLTLVGNSPDDSLIGVKHMLENMNEIIENPGINLLFEKFKNKPAVIVSTGPSLNKNKHLLKGIEDKALIISADSALKILMNMGVKPHLVTMLERGNQMWKLVEGFSSDEVQDVYFAACPVINPKGYEVYRGPKVIVYRAFDHFKWTEIDRGMLNIKQSAGNMSFKIAEALGCNPIILIGQDLAYSQEGHTHAKGMPFGHENKLEKVFKSMKVKANNGGEIETHEMWYQFLQSYEVDIEGYNGICINSTEGGAYIRGTNIMSFKESIEKYLKEDYRPLDIMKKNLDNFKEEKKVIERFQIIVDETIKDMEYVIDCCKEGLQIYEVYKEELIDYIKNYKISNVEIRSRIETIQQELLEPKLKSQIYNKNFQLFFMHIIQPYYINFEINMNGLPDQYEDKYIAMADILYHHFEWYNNILELANICLNLLIETKEKII